MASANTLPTLSQGQPFLPPNMTKAQLQETYHVSHSRNPTFFSPIQLSIPETMAVLFRPYPSLTW